MADRPRCSIAATSVVLGALSLSLPGCGSGTTVPAARGQAAAVSGETQQSARQSTTPADARSESLASRDGATARPVDADAVAHQVAVVEPVYRPDDVRPRHDDARAAELGIHRYESTHLLLYTDIDADVARTLPPLLDQAYDAYVEYFGPLPPARDSAEYQMTGCIMVDQDRFRAAGMLPQKASDLLVHGIHRGSEFWMNSQEYDYYQRHLMIHEGTHCFMTVLNGPQPSPWYMEGMAEFFGTHHINGEGRATFGVMPDDPARFVGFGRVEMLREEVAAGNLRSVDNVLALTSNDYVASRREPYAWSWAFCKFADAHPRYQAPFRELIKFRHDPGLTDRARRLLAPVSESLAIEWELFIRNLEYGYDIERAAIDFRRGSPLLSGGGTEFEIRADAGWQSSGVWVEAGAQYQVVAAGEVTLALEPKPWISEPQGISIRYSDGRPLGRVVAAILSETPSGKGDQGTLWQIIDVGRDCELTPTASGTLYLRVNDDWNSLHFNAGAYQVQVRRP